MQFSQIHHCSLAVQNLAQAAAFYRDVLGLVEIAVPSTFPAAGLNVRWFQIGNQQIICLWKPKRIHPANNEAMLIPGADRFFITDPDGNRIEIIEWKETYVAIPIVEQPK